MQQLFGKPKVEIFIDGGCSPNPGRGGWGAVLICPGTGLEKEFWGPDQNIESFRNQTNNRMEIIAAIEALRALRQSCEVKMHSDSTYLVNSMLGAFWKGKNMDLWRELGKLAEQHDVEWTWLPREHEKLARPHELANEAIRKGRNGRD